MEMDMVRAKFRCDSKATCVQTGEVNINMAPVYSDDPNSENRQYWQATPAGSIMLSCLNLTASEQFEVGKEYYVDFTPAE